jgi:hypothetical protein
MGELSAGHVLLYAVLIIATMAVLEWRESKRTRTQTQSARARRDRRGQLDASPARKAA